MIDSTPQFPVNCFGCFGLVIREITPFSLSMTPFRKVRDLRYPVKIVRVLIVIVIISSYSILVLAAGCPDGALGNDTLTCDVTPPTTGNNDEQIDADLGDDIIVQAAGVKTIDIDGDGQPTPDFRGEGNGGNDTITNYGVVMKSIAADFVTGDGGDDTIINYGTVQQDIWADEAQGKGGNDTIINGGTVGGTIYGEVGDDTIIITDHANGDSDHILYLDGGSGTDTLIFRFSDPTTYDQVNAAVKDKSATGGQITINGETYAWTNFEQIRNDPPTGITTPQPTEVANIVSLTLINADTDLPIEGFDPIPADAIINLAKLPTKHLNIRANVSGSPIGSIVFSGTAGRRTESITPYTLRGDTNGDYLSWTPAVRSYTVTATLYSKANGAGTRLQRLTLSFTVTDQADAKRTTRTLVWAAYGSPFDSQDSP
jgi:hypothetical protein